VSATATDFRLDSNLSWSTKPGNVVGEDMDPWGMCLDGRTLSGSGYYLNPGGKHHTALGLTTQMELTKRGLTIQLNPSTLSHDWELTTDMEHPLDTIEGDFAKAGLQVDMDSMRIGRLDVTRQAFMGAPCRAFIPAFNAMQGKRMKSTQYPDGYTFANGARKAIFYDKTRQGKKVKKVNTIPANLLRCELRAFRSKNVGHTERGFGVGTIGQLREVESEALLASYTRSIESNVFRFNDGRQMALDFEGEVQLLTSLREEQPRGAISFYIEMEGLERIAERFGGLETFGEALHAAGWTDRHVRRVLSRLREMLHTKAFVDRRRNNTTIATQIDLLRNTFTA